MPTARESSHCDAGEMGSRSYFYSTKEERLPPAELVTSGVRLECGCNFQHAQIFTTCPIVLFETTRLKLKLKAGWCPQRLHERQLVVPAEDHVRIGSTGEVIQDAANILRRSGKLRIAMWRRQGQHDLGRSPAASNYEALTGSVTLHRGH
jgi:hypothetical protein